MNAYRFKLLVSVDKPHEPADCDEEDEEEREADSDDGSLDHPDSYQTYKLDEGEEMDLPCFHLVEGWRKNN